MRRFALLLAMFAAGPVASAHHPNREAQPVRPRVDIIGPLGNNLPPSYRRAYNRPRYLGGKIAYWIAPSSQEAMAWHNAVHRGYYRNHRPRMETHYFYPKPWEALKVGPRTPTGPRRNGESGDASPEDVPTPTPAAQPVFVSPVERSVVTSDAEAGMIRESMPLKGPDDRF